jgi:adenylate cyclase
MEIALGKILILAILASVLVAALVSKRVTLALQILRDGVRRVQGGDLGVQLEPRSSDEFGQLTQAFNDMTAGLRQRELLKTSFEKYVASPVVEGVIRNEAPEVKSTRHEITVLFSDIAGFTKMVETESPEVLVPALNEYLGYLTDQIKRRSGTVDKFVGDAVMAIWGFEGKQEGDPVRACEAALGIQRRKTAQPGWVTRIGINTGDAIVGNIGSQNRLQYTAIGDMVNIAARLEGLNKMFGTRILVSGSTFQGCRDSGILFRNLGEVLLRGKKKPVGVYEAVALEADATPAERDFCEAFNLAVESYGARDWDEARARFQNCLKIRATDLACNHYLGQIQGHSTNPEAPLYLAAE